MKSPFFMHNVINNSQPFPYIFFSHASSDAVVNGQMLPSLLNLKNSLVTRYVKNNTGISSEDSEKVVFFSSNPENGLGVGDEIFDTLTQKIVSAEIFVAIITDNYLRSPYCIYELCLCRMLKQTFKKIVIIYSDKKVVERTPPIVDSNIFNIVLTDVNAEQILCGTHTNLFEQSDMHDVSQYFNFLRHNGRCVKPYIGQTQQEYSNIFDYCDSHGILKVKSEKIYDINELRDKIINAKTVYFVSTTGSGLLKTLKEEILPIALVNGVEFNMILPDVNSTFCDDVAIAECSMFENNDVIIKQNIKRIRAEFDATHQYLNESFLIAKKYVKDELNSQGQSMGRICCYDARTLLRQTLLLTVDLKGNMWGWMSMTIPPIRSVDSPALLFKYDVNANNQVHQGVAGLILKHCLTLMHVAGPPRIITGRTSGDSFSHRYDRASRKQFWDNQRDIARNTMNYRLNNDEYNGILIEVAAQHPLKDGKIPNEEFTRRLDEAIRIFRACKKDTDRVKIYVPGSIHPKMNENGERMYDDISLSMAGERYLLSKGIDKSDIFADETNYKYMGENGVYNSLDECYVASQIFMDMNFKSLICVCSPNQIMRKTFAYIKFSIIPKCYAVPLDSMYHDVIDEYFNSLENTIYGDLNWQDPNSAIFQQSRLDRKPN